MKLIKYFSILALVGLIAACSHGYEGKYEGQIVGNEMMRAVLGSKIITIGSDYFEADGERSTFDDISVRKIGGDKYLVFKKDSDEVALKILDKNTLLQTIDNHDFELVRV